MPHQVNIAIAESKVYYVVVQGACMWMDVCVCACLFCGLRCRLKGTGRGQEIGVQFAPLHCLILLSVNFRSGGGRIQIFFAFFPRLSRQSIYEVLGIRSVKNSACFTAGQIVGVAEFSRHSQYNCSSPFTRCLASIGVVTKGRAWSVCVCRSRCVMLMQRRRKEER